MLDCFQIQTHLTNGHPGKIRVQFCIKLHINWHFWAHFPSLSLKLKGFWWGVLKEWVEPVASYNRHTQKLQRLSQLNKTSKMLTDVGSLAEQQQSFGIPAHHTRSSNVFSTRLKWAEHFETRVSDLHPRKLLKLKHNRKQHTTNGFCIHHRFELHPHRSPFKLICVVGDAFTQGDAPA